MAIDLSRTLIQAPPIPNKYDIIPIHTSDRGTFKQCRRRWNWSSPTRLNLVPKPSVYGLYVPFWFGTGIHHALERFYNPHLKEDPVVTFETWFELQWNGGLVSYSELKEYNDRHPRLLPDTFVEGREEKVFQVEGLSDLLPDPDPDEWFGYKDLALGMLTFYKDYAQREDNFTVICVEHDFSVPLTDPETGKVLYHVDHRKIPDGWEPDFTKENAYGPLMRVVDDHVYRRVEKQVHAKGRQDLIVMDNESGRFGIVDHKTAGRIDEDYPKFLELDEQCTTYLWAGESEAKLFDLEYENLDFVIYQQLMKGYPRPPTMTTRGVPSIDRQNETTTAELFEKCIKENNLQIIYENDIKLQSYYAWLLERGDKIFVDRKTVRRNRNQKMNCGRRLYYEALDMLNDPHLYPNPTRTYPCINCAFRTPCIAAEDGGDWESMLEDGYEPNWDR